MNSQILLSDQLDHVGKALAYAAVVPGHLQAGHQHHDCSRAKESQQRCRVGPTSSRRRLSARTSGALGRRLAGYLANVERCTRWAVLACSRTLLSGHLRVQCTTQIDSMQIKNKIFASSDSCRRLYKNTPGLVPRWLEERRFEVLIESEP